MTYAEKLKDQRWLQFRAAYIGRRSDDHGTVCDECGEDTPLNTVFHVHHRIYRNGFEPWEYEDAELMLLCRRCHEFLHQTERRVRTLVTGLYPHECCEFNDLLDELDAALKQGEIKRAFAHAKNSVRNLLA